MPCKVTIQAMQTVTDFMPKELLEIKTTAGIVSSSTADYIAVYDKIVSTLAYDKQAE